MRFIVSIEFLSPTLTLAEICGLLGKDINDDSYSVGEIRKFGKRVPLKYSNLRWFSDPANEIDLLACFDDAVAKFGQADLAVLDGRDVKMKVSIAVFFETAFNTCAISSRIIDWAADHNFEIEVISYPGSEDSPV